MSVGLFPPPDHRAWWGRELSLDSVEPLQIITLQQPWASMVAHGLKRFETRSWTTPHRGKLIIHAGGAWDLRNQLMAQTFAMEFARAGVNAQKLPLGVVVCLTSIEDMHRTERLEHTLTPLERSAGDYGPNRMAWRLGPVERFMYPPKWRGAQGIRPATPELRELVGQALIDNRGGCQ